jgi:hypothetical protein
VGEGATGVISFCSILDAAGQMTVSFVVYLTRLLPLTSVCFELQRHTENLHQTLYAQVPSSVKLSCRQMTLELPASLPQSFEPPHEDDPDLDQLKANFL